MHFDTAVILFGYWKRFAGEMGRIFKGRFPPAVYPKMAAFGYG
jgi:hypothetical protein